MALYRQQHNNQKTTREVTHLMSPAQSIARSREGITFPQMDKIVKEAGFSLAYWAKYLHLSERSLQRYFKEKKTFELPQAERIFEIESLFVLGNQVFGDTSKFRQWLQRPSVALGGQEPVSFFDTSEGIRLISAELHRIEHGIFA